jgi:hypothetical protein
MDQELKQYLDAKFAEIDAKFALVDRRAEAMEASLKALIEKTEIQFAWRLLQLGSPHGGSRPERFDDGVGFRPAPWAC